jgi:hypothetical protein
MSATFSQTSTLSLLCVSLHSMRLCVDKSLFSIVFHSVPQDFVRYSNNYRWCTYFLLVNTPHSHLRIFCEQRSSNKDDLDLNVARKIGTLFLLRAGAPAFILIYVLQYVIVAGLLSKWYTLATSEHTCNFMCSCRNFDNKTTGIAMAFWCIYKLGIRGARYHNL